MMEIKRHVIFALNLDINLKKRAPRLYSPVTSLLLNDRIRIKSMMKESDDSEEKQILNFR